MRGGGLKPVQKTVLAALLALAIAPAHAAVTVWDWGGYVATSDSPVVGGAVYGYTSCGMSAGIGGCSQYYLDIAAYGKIAYTGTAYYGRAMGGGTNQYLGIKPTCPLNTAQIEMPVGYIRPDTSAVWNKYYNGAWQTLSGNGLTIVSVGTSGAFGSTNVTNTVSGDSSFVCVKTDTY